MSLTHSSNQSAHSANQLALRHGQDTSQEILRAVEELKQGSGFGSIEIVLHEGRVTQIEKREKLRFSQDNTKDNSKDHTKHSPSAPARAK